MEGVGTMNPTHDQNQTTAEPRRAATFDLGGLPTDDLRFRTWLATAVAKEIRPAAKPDTDRDHYVVTDAGGQPLADSETDGEAPGTAASVLRSAAVYLERHGWIQGAYYDATSTAFTPAACTVGAIGMVCYGGPVDAPAQHFDDPGYLDFEEAVLHLDRYLLVEDGSESYEFNDAKGRQLADVLRVLRQAADTPADELIGAIRVIDAKNPEMATLAALLTPCGLRRDDVSTDGGDA
jgi:hypothetical protein